jgi:hypothetical protein
MRGSCGRKPTPNRSCAFIEPGRGGWSAFTLHWK